MIWGIEPGVIGLYTILIITANAVFLTLFVSRYTKTATLVSLVAPAYISYLVIEGTLTLSTTKLSIFTVAWFVTGGYTLLIHYPGRFTPSLLEYSPHTEHYTEPPTTHEKADKSRESSKTRFTPKISLLNPIRTRIPNSDDKPSVDDVIADSKGSLPEKYTETTTDDEPRTDGGGLFN